MINSLQELVVYPAPTHLKFASLANSKHILTGQKNSALTSLQCSRLATENQNLWKLAPTWLRHCNHNSEMIIYFQKNHYFLQCSYWCDAPGSPVRIKTGEKLKHAIEAAILMLTFWQGCLWKSCHSRNYFLPLLLQ